MTDGVPRPLDRDDQPDDEAADRLDALPAHEVDDPGTIGGGLMSSGGTAVDRGTGSLDGRAEGDAPDGDEGMLPSAIHLDDHERFDVDDAAKPGIDDHTD